MLAPSTQRKKSASQGLLSFCYNHDMDNTYTPLRDIVLIKVDAPKTQTDSGIIIKEDWKTLPPTGVILAGGEDMPPHYEGKHVVFERYSAIVLDDDLRLCKLSNILAFKDAEVRK